MPELIIDAVVCDMDGVLIDSGGIYERHWQRWATCHGVDPARIVAVHFGRPAVETIRLVAPQLDAIDEARRYNEELAADEDVGSIVALPGAARLLASLAGGRWGVATSAPRVMAERWLAAAGLPPPVLVSIDDVAHGKPAPDPYLRAAELLGVDPRRCLVIEDAPAGITAARAAGASVLAVRTTHPSDALTEADGVTDDLTTIDVSTSTDAILVRWQDPA